MQEDNNEKYSFQKFIQLWLIPIVLTFFLIVISFFPTVVEKYYSTGLYPTISKLQRKISGTLNFSIGDVFYFLVIFILLKRFIKLIRLIINKNARKNIGKFLLIGLRKILWFFIYFQVLWGLNYYRTGIAHQIQIEKADYSKEDVELLVCDLVQKLNTIRPLISKDNLPQPSFNEIIKEAIQLYDTIKPTYQFINNQNDAVKKSLFSSVSHYIGFTGYYNPFSGEAQLSTDIPKILAPYIVCHEIAHQLGYAQEDEANFVGYLVCSKSANLYFQYSVYLDLYKYAATELLMMNETNTHNWELNKLVRKDLKDIRSFFLSKKNNIEPLMTALYGQYLKANRQSKGLESYNDVIGLLISKKKKYGGI